MTPEQLKASILQYAIQGKLVEQRPEEGTAEELVLKLLQAKSELEQKKKILKKAPTEPFYSAEELSGWDIPESWRWVQLSDVSIIQEGAGIRKWQYRDSGTQILCVTNILDGSIDIGKKELYISTEEYEEKYLHLTLNEGDIVTSCSGGSWGKIAFFDVPKTMMLNTSTLRMRFFDDIADNNYLYYVCKSRFFKLQLMKQLSGMQPNFGYAHYSRIMLPIPPLEEQHRIVAKIEELLPYIDRYAAAYEKLEQFNAKFPEDMKKSILQYAIQGKLVEQRPEEGTGEELYRQIQTEKQRLIKEGKIKKEKPLADIAEDEIPFDIPESWKWYRLGELTYNWGQKTPDNRFCYVDVGSVNNTSHTLNSENTVVEAKNASSRAKKIVKYGDVIFATIRPYLKNICIIDRDFPYEPIVSTAFAVMHCPEGLLNKYLYYYLLSPTFMSFANASDKAKGVAYPAIGEKDFFNGIIALPPLAEQKRIVAKIEELLPFCERLK